MWEYIIIKILPDMLSHNMFSQKLMFEHFEQKFEKVLEDIPLKIKDPKNYQDVVSESDNEENVEHIDLEEQEDAALDG